MILELTAAIFVFLAVAGIALTVFGGSPAGSAIEQRLKVLNLPSTNNPQLEAGGLLKRGTSSLPILRLLLTNSRWNDEARIALEQAGLRLKVSEYLLLRFLGGVIASLAVIFLAGGTATGLLLTLVAAGVGYMAPAWYVNLRKTRRRTAIGAQLVEALQLISNSLRSGFAFTQAVEMAAKQLTPPIQVELNHFLRDNALGARTDDALRAMVERSGSVDMEMMVTTIMVQRTAGGNLSEILDNVAETIRERERLQGEIHALTAQQRLTGLILSVYPLVLGLLFFLIFPSLMKVLWEEELGRVLLLVAGVLQVMGAFSIRQILKLDV